jgi:FXSXX-COOH protein
MSIEGGLIDLVDIDLSRLLGAEGDALSHSLSRIIYEADHPEGAFAGFVSSV